VLCAVVFTCALPATNALAQQVTGRIKGTVKVTTGVATVTPDLLPGARLTLTNRDLKEQRFNAVADESGAFIFEGLPAATFLLTVEADGLPKVTKEIALTSGATLAVEIVMTATLSESVTVHQEEGLLSSSETTTSNTIRSETLNDTPLRSENFQSTLLLTPGVVRGLDGVDHQKGARAGTNAYTVNGVDITDPATGNLAFDIPLEAASSVRVEENPYSAEFGQLTGGATELETKSGGNKFKFTAARFFPTFRGIIGGKIDSFRPRVTFSGPLVSERLFFLQSFEYRFTRARVPSLKAPGDDSTFSAFNSFSQFDYKISKNNTAKLVVAFFPGEDRFVGLNTFNPQSTTPTVTRSGALVSLSEQAILSNGSFLDSWLSYGTNGVDVSAPHIGSLELRPEGNTGNYFATVRRDSRRLQWREGYFARPFQLHGEHSLKLGAEVHYLQTTGTFSSNAILIHREDGTLARRIEFVGADHIARQQNEYSAFAQDRWVVNQSLTFDGGVRFDHDGLARLSNIAPRLSFMYRPLSNSFMIVRGGVGVFSDRAPLSVGYFSQLPGRIVTTYADDGVSITDGPRLFEHRRATRLRNPFSLRWSLQTDFAISKSLTTRVGYMQRQTTKDFLVDSTETVAQSTLMLNSRGRSVYREVQVLGTYANSRLGRWNASYTWSSTHGDLNSIDNFLGDLPPLVVLPNERGPLSFDAPHRFLAYGEIKAPYQITISPVAEMRSGFPFSAFNDRLDGVGRRNRAGRYPTYVSLDLQVVKGFTLPKAVPRFGGRRARVGLAVLNVTNHFNPRDVQNNMASTHFGQFFNSLNASVRGKFEFDF
jgi:hypothetical protein